MATSSVSRTTRTRTTRHHRCDYPFLELLEEDYGIDQYSLNKAFMGMPAAPKKQAIALCEWATRQAGGDPDRAGELLRAWAKKNGAGTYSRRLVEAPALTYGTNAYLRSIGQL